MSAPDDEIGDYVLGLLEPGPREAFEAAMRTDPELADRVRSFAAQLEALDETAELAAIPPGLWGRIETRLTAPAAPAAPAARRQAMPGWFAVAASVVIAAGAGFVGGQMLRAPAPAPVVIAVLLSDTQAPGAIVEAFANNSVHIIPLEAIDVPSGKILEVWTKPSEAIGPVSLGRFLEPAEIVLPPTDLPVPVGGQLYEITLEDAPGSPTGRPTGPILFKGLGQPPI